MPNSQSQLLLRHSDRIFGPVSFEQVQELLEAGKVQNTDSVREGDGPWIQIRDYLDWKAEQQTPVADISELFGNTDSKPKKTAEASAKPAQGSGSTVIPDDAPLLADDDDPLPVETKPRKPKSSLDDYIPLADPEPQPKNDLAETAEVPQTETQTRKPKTSSGSVSGDRKRKRAGGSSATGRSSASGKPASGTGKSGGGKSGSGVRPKSPSGEQRSRRKSTGRSSQATQSFRLADNADLDSILRAMATYEMTADSLDSPPATSPKKRRRTQ